MDFQTNQPDVYPGMDSQVDTAGDFRKIADETINRNKLDAARQPYDELRRLGFGADEIGTLTSCGSISGHLVTIPYQIIKHIPTSALLEA